MKLGIVNLGCPKNTVDMECMISLLGGPVITTDPAEADVIIINTCAFLKSARKESEEAISGMLSYRKNNPGLKVIVSGCFVSKDRKMLAEKFRDIHSFVGINDIYSIKQAVEKSGSYCSAPPFTYKNNDHNVILNPYSVYVKISEGCNHKCSFCIIPSIKGRYRSRGKKDIINEVKKLAGAGVKEINLISQDLSYYGKDLKKNAGLPGLVRGILNAVDEKIWIRLMYLYPDKEVLSGLADIMKKDSRLVKYMDIPFQHITDPMLASMRRGYRKKDITAIISMLRAKAPDITLRSSFIAGYPGESKKDFNELKDFILSGAVDKPGIFLYSDEPDSFSYRLKGKVSEKTAALRCRSLMLDSEKVCLYNNKSKIKKEMSALVLGRISKNRYIGRFETDAPDVDSFVNIRADKSLKEGSFIKAAVKNADSRSFEAAAAGIKKNKRSRK